MEQFGLMLEDLEAQAPASAPPSGDVEQSSSPAERKKSGRKPLAEHLPRREVLHEPSCTCPACGGEMRKVGEDVTEVLDYVPGPASVQHNQPLRHSCRRCESSCKA